MKLKKDPFLMKMTLVPLLILIALLAEHSEAQQCYVCEVPQYPYENCDRGPPTSSTHPTKSNCKSNTCFKYIQTSGGSHVRTLRGCWGLEDCWQRSGCKTYTEDEFIELYQKCGVPRKVGVADLTEVFKNAKETSGGGGDKKAVARQGSASYRICVCTGNLCLASEANGGGGEGFEESNAKYLKINFGAVVTLSSISILWFFCSI